MNQTIEALRQRMATAVAAKEAEKENIMQSITAATVRVKDLEAQLKTATDYETVSAIRAEIVSRNEFIGLMETKLRKLNACTEEEKNAYNAFKADAKAAFEDACGSVQQYLSGINPAVNAKYAELEEDCQMLREIVISYKDAFGIDDAEGRFTTPAQLEPYRIAAQSFSGNKAE